MINSNMNNQPDNNKKNNTNDNYNEELEDFSSEFFNDNIINYFLICTDSEICKTSWIKSCFISSHVNNDENNTNNNYENNNNNSNNIEDEFPYKSNDSIDKSLLYILPEEATESFFQLSKGILKADDVIIEGPIFKETFTLYIAYVNKQVGYTNLLKIWYRFYQQRQLYIDMLDSSLYKLANSHPFRMVPIYIGLKTFILLCWRSDTNREILSQDDL